VRADSDTSAAGKAARRAGQGLLVFGAIVLAANMRAAITSLPPVFPELQHALHLSAGEIAVLAAIPVLCFGLFSGMAAPLSRKFGEERVLGAALVLLAAGLVARGVAPGAGLFAGTIVAGAAIALLNVLLPSLVKRRVPERAGLLIGLYLGSLSTGAIIASLIAVPVFDAASHGGSPGGGSAAVRLTLSIWALPALAAAVAWAPQLRYRTRPGPGVAPEPGAGPAEGAGATTGTGTAPGARPAAGGGRPRAGLRRHALTWQVTTFMGLQSLSYYAALSWFPTLFRDRGASAVHAGTLLAVMGLGNAVTALGVPWLAHRLRDQRLLALAAMAATGAGLAGAAWGPLGAAVPLVFLLGMGQGATLGLAIFYTMARAPDPVTAASLSAFAQGIGYLLASAGPLLLGFLHTATGGWTIPVWALMAVVALQLLTGWLAGRDLTVPAVPAAPAAAG
jgi:CP family cyanate transporter-like MFS transporter